MLESAVSGIKSMSKGIGTHLNEEKKLQQQLDGGFTKTKAMVEDVMGNMNTILNSTAGSMCLYVCIFTSIWMVLLVKYG